jgi:inner membrane protein
MFQAGLGPQAAGRVRSRSMGVKLIVVCGLALVMTIPALFVESTIEDRTKRSQDVTREISQLVGGEQTFLGPTLAVPYKVPAGPASTSEYHGVYYIFPAQASAAVKTSTEERRRSLFKVPVFQADLKLDSTFDLTEAPNAAPAGAELDWKGAEIVAGVSDSRGALADATLTAGEKTVVMAPAQNASYLAFGNDEAHPSLRLTLFGVAPGETVKPGAKFSVSCAMKFSGAQRIAVLAYGKTTHVTAQGDWRDPGFDGGFLPVSRSVSDGGFKAEWQVPFIARGVRAEGGDSTVAGLDSAALGISFVEVADPYQSVDRSLKYVALFLGLLFLTYFIFEATTRKRVHPAQYVLVGVAQIIFYLLLLSLAERIGFDFGFLIAGAATVSLLAANAGWIFTSRVQGMRTLGVFTALYVLIYMLLRLEDNALLVGAIASFMAVAAAMYFTRRIDWYSSLPGLGLTGPAADSVAPKG